MPPPSLYSAGLPEHVTLEPRQSGSGHVFDVGKPNTVDGAIIEAWAQGYMIGSLIIMAVLTLANMRRGVLLHKLILVELLFGCFHGTFIFTDPPVYNWYLSTTAILLNISWSLHNVIAWIKNKPFLGRKTSIFYITTVALVQPYWVLEIVANFLYFSGKSDLFRYTRPYEALFRDPWWIFTICNLLYNIKTRYEFGFLELMRVSPRFGVLLGSMIVSFGFIIVDICAVTHAFSNPDLPNGVNPFWKLAFVFKCLTDTIILDDFKTALDKLKQHKLERMGTLGSDGFRGDFVDVRQAQRQRAEDDFITAQNMRLQDHGTLHRDWSKSGDPEHLDLHAALRMGRRSGSLAKQGESSGSRSSGG
ncbi:hypothetical protein MBLNU230_g2140t1 [Neophaeotheca triangularis]